MSWYSGLKGRILCNEPLAQHTTIKVGPEALLWVEPYDRDDLRDLVRRSRAKQKDYLVVGRGSKLLIKKKRIPLAIHLASPDFKSCSADSDVITAAAGVSLARLLEVACASGLGGLEFLSGIPASVGGAVMLNAGVGWPERIEIGPFIKQVEVMDKYGRIRNIDGRDIKFGYRSCGLKHYIILSAAFRLFKKRKNNIRIKMRKFLDYRRQTQELAYPSAGCIFKNCNGQSSGRLIDMCGLKGRRVGGAVISRRHANFIVNTGGATSGDILALMSLARKEVKKKFNTELKPEIQVI